MESNRPVTGTGDTADAAEQDAASKADAGTYSVSIKGKVKKDGANPQPTPIGDYRATLTPSG